MKILIDNGHGVNTAGKRSPYSGYGAKPALELLEYRWAREIAAKIYLELRQQGYDAELLVTEDQDIDLATRCHRANLTCNVLGKNNVILISIHGNAFGNGRTWNSARGWSAYTTPGTTKSDTLAEYLYRAAEENFAGMKIRRDLTDGDSDLEASFYILKYTLCPAVLTENFFYTNVDDCKYMLSDEGKKAIVKTHVDGIIRYIDSL